MINGKHLITPLKCFDLQNGDSSTQLPFVIFRSSGSLSNVLCCHPNPTSSPFHPLRHYYPNHKSLLGHPTTSQPKRKFVHPPMLDNDGFRTVVYKRNRCLLSIVVSQDSIDIEAKIFRSIQKHNVHGIALQISKHWPSLFRTILVPLDALTWVTKTFKEAIEDHSISAQQWLHKGYIKLSVCIPPIIGVISSVSRSSSPTGAPSPFASQKVETTQDGPSFYTSSLNRSRRIITQKVINVSNTPFTAQDHISNFLSWPDPTTSQHRLTPAANFPRPWLDPADSLLVVTQCRPPVTSSDNDWAKAIICDCVECPFNLEATSKGIANACNLDFLPSFTLFGEGKALFFCYTMSQSITASSVGCIRVRHSTVFLNKYYRLANAIDQSKSKFKGWIHIRGLPFVAFDSWNTKIFKSIAEQSMGWTGGGRQTY